VTVAVVTDSAAALPAEVAAGLDVTVVPLLLTVGGVQHRDGDLPLYELLPRLDGGVTTSGPTPAQLQAAIEKRMTTDGVVVLTIASTMSSTHDAAVLAADSVAADAPGPVRVVDTATAAGAQGLVVVHAARAAARGASIDEVEAAARAAIERVQLVATVDSLDRLVASGRVPGLAGRAGRLLNVNPLFRFHGGHVGSLRPAFTRDAALERILGRWRKTYAGGSRLHVAALHAVDEEAATHLLEEVRATVDPATAFVGSFSSVMVVHTGPGLVGLAWWWEPPPPADR